MVTAHPATAREAAAAKQAGGLPYAGGTDLMIRHSKNIQSGQCPPLVFLDDVEELHGITPGNGELRIGALTTMAELCAGPDVPGLLAHACNAMGSPALRNVATIGGNVCTASPAGDSLPALYALDGEVELVSPESLRRMPVAEFISGPGKTALAPDEILAAIILPAPGPSLFHHRKVGPRVANAITKVSLAVALDVKGRTVRNIRIACGSVGPTVIRCTRLEKKCTGATTDDLCRDADRLTALVEESVHPIDDQRSTANYRRSVAANLFAEFLDTLNTPGT